MEDQFNADQWQNAEASAVKIISEARRSARFATEMLRMWNKTQLLDSWHRDVNKAFSIRSKRR